MLIFLRRTDWKDFTFKILDGWSFPPHRQYPLHSINQDFHPLHLHCCYLGKPALLQVVSPHLQKVCRKKTLLHYIKVFFFMCSASCLQLPPHQKGCSRKPLFTFRHTQKQTFKMIRVVWPECLWSTLSYLWKCSQRLCSRLRPLLHVIPLLSFPNFQCIFNVTSVLEKCHKNNILGKKLCFFLQSCRELALFALTLLLYATVHFLKCLQWRWRVQS